jgi:glycopeptide antibiotics resistance protein
MLPGPKPHLALFRNVGVVDGILNVIGFVPLGLLGWIWIGGRRRAWSGTVSAIVIIGSITLFSAALEFVQLGIPERFCSINDVFFNGLGGTLGVLTGRIRGQTTLGSAALANARSGTHGE